MLHLAVQSAILWGLCRLLGARRQAPAGTVPVSFGRAAAAAVLAWAVSVAVLVGVARVVPPESLPVLAAGALVVNVLVSLAVVAVVVRPSAPKGFAVTILWVFLAGFWGTGLFFGLKEFVGEAFVIPTGNMADTLRGTHKEVTCPSCGHTFAVNCSGEESTGDRPAQTVNGCTCPNCQQSIRLVDPRTDGRQPREGVQRQDGPRGAETFVETAMPEQRAGDRVLVAKGWLTGRPARFGVVTFRYPERPDFIYMKRLVGLPGETVAFAGGDLYRLPPEATPAGDEADAPAEELWRPQHLRTDAPEVRKLWDEGKFTIVRKPPAVVVANMRLVYDADHPPRDLEGDEWKRWRESDGWLTYRHLLRRGGGKPSLVTDFLGYNTAASYVWNPNNKTWDGFPQFEAERGGNWVGDLVLEGTVTVERAGNLSVRLARAGELFQAHWDSEKNAWELSRGRAGGGWENLATAGTNPLKGTHRVRFANVDRRLTLWVDDRLVFGDGIDYETDRTDPTAADLTPARVQTDGGLRVSGLKLYRDLYLAHQPGQSDVRIEDATDPEKWDKGRARPVRTYYIRPGHYFVLGDNPNASSDSRTWGLVPERHLLGRAEFVYYPWPRVGRIK